MADVELVIKIPEGLKKDFETEQWTTLSCMEMKNALMNSTPLPKGHGNLIDAKAYKEKVFRKYHYNDWDDSNIRRITKLAISDAPIIIEADKNDE